MPKKFAGDNSKAATARARKTEKAEAEKTKKEKEKEDAEWKDDDKSLAKKQARKEEAERKRQEAATKKQERDALIALEENAEKDRLSKKAVGATANKITRAQIQETNERREAAAKGKQGKPDDRRKSESKENPTHLETPLEENLNRVDIESETATTLDEAIAVLSIKDPAESVDKHPEKRMKAAHDEFQNIRLPQLKAENPNLRLSQLKQMLHKEWIKSPDNPLNQQLAATQSNSDFLNNHF